ncbi:NAD(P)H-dependent flavin oxidoreductase [Variovorax sp. PBL-E5]|uniref:NAD(P)H-dependent flavin oxidoreductase n=1 Tax=Variovorax sp. PBL-E5 TaxID=434014 RepID=UPI001319815A|nr:nitronate monooxygenase [Variovorax sp. PBL-E5]VTU34435.1 Nitronate monooxygenase [Variovorax sp. PBL-E5]
MHHHSSEFLSRKYLVLTERLGIRYPILCATAGGPFTIDLAVAVAEAGGLGGLGVTRWPDELAKDRVRMIGARTSKPFAVGIILAILPSASRKLALVLEAGAPVVQFSWGTPTPEQVALVRSFGAKLSMQVTNLGGARQALDVGVDYIVCQGQEAGGHVQAQSSWLDTLAPILEIAGDTPVVVAGGLGDGKALRKVLLNGASGGIFGTRFVATRESCAIPEWKEQLTTAIAADTALTVCFDEGWPQSLHRVLRNETLNQWEASGSMPKGRRPGEGEVVANDGTNDILRYEATSPIVGMSGDPAETSMWAGIGVDAIHDIPPAGELVRRIWAECVGDSCSSLAPS